MPGERIRVLLCSSSLDAGGSERQLLYLLNGLDRTRFEPVLYLLYESGVLLTEVPQDIPRIAFWSQHQFPRWNWPGRIHRMQVRHLAQTLREQKIDVVYDRLFHMTMITGPASQQTHTARVSTIVSPPQFDLTRSEKRWVRMKKQLLRKSYASANKVLTVGAGTADNASEYYQLPREQFTVMLSPIDIERIDALAAKPWTGTPLRPNRRNIISIGRLSDEKGHRYLISAFAKYVREASIGKLPEADLHIVGDGVLRKELTSQVHNLGIDERVVFHGQVSNPHSLLRQCDLMCLPSLYEGMPNAMLEAMACRVPVLATNTQQGPGELLRSRPLGTLVPKANVDELSNAIRDRFETPGPWLSRVDAARAYVEENHNLVHWVESMSQVFEQVAGKARSR